MMDDDKRRLRRVLKVSRFHQEIYKRMMGIINLLTYSSVDSAAVTYF